MAIDFPANPTNGQVYGNYIYDSSITAWRNVNTDTGIGTLNAMGLKNVVPTSINVGSGSATMNSNGTVTFTAASLIRLNGVFTSSYKNYKILIAITGSSTSQACNLRVSASGTDETGGNYAYAATYAGGGSTSASTEQGVGTTSVANVTVPYSAQYNAMVTLEFINPAVSGAYTMASYGGNNYRPAQGIETRHGSFTTFTTTAYDGITLIANSGNISGTMNVYGYTN